MIKNEYLIVEQTESPLSTYPARCMLATKFALGMVWVNFAYPKVG
jgi:hypothetical protein